MRSVKAKCRRKILFPSDYFLFNFLRRGEDPHLISLWLAPNLTQEFRKKHLQRFMAFHIAMENKLHHLSHIARSLPRKRWRHRSASILEAIRTCCSVIRSSLNYIDLLESALVLNRHNQQEGTIARECLVCISWRNHFNLSFTTCTKKPRLNAWLKSLLFLFDQQIFKFLGARRETLHACHRWR